MDEGTSVCFVMIPKENPSLIAGFYTLSAATVTRSLLPEALTKGLPKYAQLPATLLGRLARSVQFKGVRLGERLLMSAMVRSLAAAREVASWTIVADPKDESARRFYMGFGFRPLTTNRLYLPMKEVAEWLRLP
jgi:predicted GNAT family N-acyltransferase